MHKMRLKCQLPGFSIENKTKILTILSSFRAKYSRKEIYCCSSMCFHVKLVNVPHIAGFPNVPQVASLAFPARVVQVQQHVKYSVRMNLGHTQMENNSGGVLPAKKPFLCADRLGVFVCVVLFRCASWFARCQQHYCCKH